MARRRRTILHELHVRAGGGVSDVRRASRAFTWLLQWSLASQELGHLASGSEYARWWGVDERTAWRHRAAIRELLSEDELRRQVDRFADEITRRRERGESIAPGQLRELQVV